MTIIVQIIGLACFALGFAGLMAVALIAFLEDRQCQTPKQPSSSALR